MIGLVRPITKSPRGYTSQDAESPQQTFVPKIFQVKIDLKVVSETLSGQGEEVFLSILAAAVCDRDDGTYAQKLLQTIATPASLASAPI